MTDEQETNHAFARSRSNAGLADHYKALFERHMADATRYQALLFHSWKTLREQQKGLRRQAKKIKMLKQRIAELTANA